MNNTERAKALLTDEFFTGVVEKQRQMYISSIIHSAEDAVDVRERTLMKLRALDEFIASLESIAKSGDIKEKRWKVF